MGWQFWETVSSSSGNCPLLAYLHVFMTWQSCGAEDLIALEPWLNLCGTVLVWSFLSGLYLRVLRINVFKILNITCWVWSTVAYHYVSLVVTLCSSISRQRFLMGRTCTYLQRGRCNLSSLYNLKSEGFHAGGRNNSYECEKVFCHAHNDFTISFPPEGEVARDHDERS